MSNVGGWVRDTRDLIASGIEGAALPPQTGAALARAAQHSWMAATLGACVGVVTGILSDDRKPSRGAVVGGFLGAAVGLSAGIAWNARDVIASVADGARKNVSAVRDTQWLAKNPIDYA